MHTADEGLQRARAGDGRDRTRSACRSCGASGSPRASCSRRSAASRARPTSCITAIPPWTTWPSAGPLRAGCDDGGDGSVGQRPRALRLPAAAGRRPNGTARAGSLERWRRAPTGARSPPRELDTLMRVLRRGPRRRRLRRRHPARARARARGAELPLPRRARAGRPLARGARVSVERSRIWRRACRSSCGAACPTTRCATTRRADGCASPPCCAATCAACSPTRGRARSWTASRCSG